MNSAKKTFFSIFDSLRYKNFKLYFIGQCISLVGTWMQSIAMSWLMYNLTGSIALLGTVVFVSQIPTLLVTPIIAAFVDRFDKKKILIFTQLFSMIHAVVLAGLVFSGFLTSDNIWIIVVLSFLLGIVNALDMPTRQAFYTTLVPRENLANAVALNSAIINGSRLIGPAIGGVLIGLVGEGGCFLFNAISYIFVIIALIKIVVEKQEPKPKDVKISKDILEGFNYMRNKISLKALLLLSLIFSFFVFPLTTFVPAYVKDTLGGDSQTLGLLMAFVGIGAFTSAMFLASRKTVLGLEKLIVIAVFVASLVLIPYFFVTNLFLSLLLSILLGFGLVCTIASLNTMIQALTDQNMKGRIMGYYSMCFIGGSALGSLLLGYITKFIHLNCVMAASGIIGIITIAVFTKFIPVIRNQTESFYLEI